MTILHSDDFRLGAPAPTSAARDHVCPFCEGGGDGCSVECYCDGYGVITAADATAIAAEDPDPRWQARPLAAPPRFTGRRCDDCAFRPGSSERDRGLGTAASLFAELELGSGGGPFYCHQGMHHGARGYVPRQRDRQGVPIGHPICAGWLAEHRRSMP